MKWIVFFFEAKLFFRSDKIKREGAKREESRHGSCYSIDKELSLDFLFHSKDTYHIKPHHSQQGQPDENF